MPTIVESFEDLQVTNNSPRVNYGGGYNGYLAVGRLNAFTFDSGLVFVYPVAQSAACQPGRRLSATSRLATPRSAWATTAS